MTTTQGSITNNERIAKNTIFLYGRMFLMLLISLYTSRVILQTLGVVDYGLYNVVGGVISLLGFLTGALSSSTQRFLTFHLGKGDESKLREVFSTAIILHFAIAFLVLILGETIGLWFVLHKLVIPPERMDAALWVYHFSILISMVGIISSPYNAVIIAHEKMGAFAYISILDAALKLTIVFVLMAIPFDKLKFFAVALFLISLLVRIIYGSYCGRHFKESLFVKPHNKDLLKEMLSFGGWNMMGGLSGVLFWHGLSILLNMFFGPAINAARGIALQVQSTIQQFSTNFQTALNPQITKTYASNQLDQMHSLIFRSSKFAFILLFVICLPIAIESFSLLELWLGIVPEYTSIFIKLILGIMIVDAMSNPLMIAVSATGKVKVYQIVVSIVLLSIVPISYMVLKLGGSPWSVFLVHLCVGVIAMSVRLLIVRPLISLSLLDFSIKVFKPCIHVLVTALPLPLLLHFFLNNETIRLIVVIVVSILSAGISSYFLGLTTRERAFLTEKIAVIFQRLRK